jgi:hypothetical protein
MNTEVRVCGDCGKVCDPSRSKASKTNDAGVDVPMCVECVIEESRLAMKAMKEEDRAEARANDIDYDSDDWNSDNESDDEE